MFFEFTLANQNFKDESDDNVKTGGPLKANRRWKFFSIRQVHGSEESQNLFYFSIKIRFFSSHRVHPDNIPTLVSIFSTSLSPPSPTHLPSLPDPPPSIFLQQRSGFQETTTKKDTTRYNKTKQMSNRSNPIGGKVSQEQEDESETYPIPV